MVDDLISRQAAIDAIDECFKKVVRAGNMSAYEYDSAYTQGEIDAYVTAIDTVKTLPAAQPEQVCVADVTLTDEQVKEVVEKAKNAVISVIELEPHWIPVSERLPETYGAYLVQDVCGVIFVDYWRGYWLAKTTMVAWRELPEPYKG